MSERRPVEIILSVPVKRVAASTLGESFTGDYERIADIEVARTIRHGDWLCLWCHWGAFHIVPVLDAVKHHVAEGDECVCGPAVEALEDGTWMISHASLDGRELAEQAAEKGATP